MQHAPLRRLAAIAVVASSALVACGDGDDDAATGDTEVAVTESSPPSEPPGTSVAAPATSAGTDATTAPSTPATSTAAGGPIVVEHHYGTTEIPATPLRIVSASVTMTGPLLAIDAPVVAGVATVPSKLADENGFFTQWGAVAAERGVEPIPGPEVNIEAVAAQDPDLIIGSAFGGDAVTEDVYALLSEVAPTVVIDHSALNVEELTSAVGRATGRHDAAAAVLAELDGRIDEVAEQLDTSAPVAPVVIGETGGLNVLTPVSAHGQLLTSLGFTVKEVDATMEGELSGGGARQDVVELSPETLGEQLGDATLLFVFAEQADVDAAAEAVPTIAALPAFQEGRAHPLGYDSFRLDPYSAATLLDTIEALSS